MKDDDGTRVVTGCFDYDLMLPKLLPWLQLLSKSLLWIQLTVANIIAMNTAAAM